MTIILATFIPCGAKTVIIAMFSALFFRQMWYVAPMMDVIGIAIIVLGGIALKKTRAFAGDAAPFVMELPAYHMPTVSGVWRHTWTRVKAYVWKAGCIIFPACVFLWFVMHFSWGLSILADEEIERSILASVGGWFAWLLAPLGFGTWQGVAASVSAEIAKEQATATLGLVAANMDAASTAARIQALFASFGDFPQLAGHVPRDGLAQVGLVRHRLPALRGLRPRDVRLPDRRAGRRRRLRNLDRARAAPRRMVPVDDPAARSAPRRRLKG